MGGSKKVTIGYKYKLSVLFALCHGPVNSIRKISAEERTAWTGTAEGDVYNLYIDKPDLFGGEKNEGGYQGWVRVGNGQTSGLMHSLTAAMGTLRPRYRGLVTALFDNFYWSALNPYIKPPEFQVVRTTEGWYDGVTWNPSRAEIASDDPVKMFSEDWDSSDAFAGYYLPATGSNVGVISAGFSYAVDISETPSIQCLLIKEAPTLYPHPRLDKNFDGGKLKRVSFLFNIRTLSTGDCGAVTLRDGNGDPVASFNLRRDASYEPSQRFTVSNGGSGVAGTPISDDALDADTWYVCTADAVYTETTGKLRVWLNRMSDDEQVGYGVFNFDKNASVSRISFENDAGSGDSGSAWIGEVRLEREREVDMNPAHIIYEALTNPVWGAGYATGDLDNASFKAAAKKLYEEAFGISIGWFGEQSIEEFVQLILDHIDGVVRLNTATGLLELKLLRNDYTIGDLLTVDETIVKELTAFSRASWGDLANEVIVNFESYDGKPDIVSAANLAAIEAQGGRVSKTIEMPGLKSARLANRVAERELLKASSLLAQVSLQCNRRAAGLHVGDVFKFSWAPLGIEQVIMRVVSIDYGTLEDGTVKIGAVEDIFALSRSSYIEQQESLADQLEADPEDVSAFKLTEATYYQVATEISPADLGAIEVDASFPHFVAGRPTPDSQWFKIASSPDGIAFDEAESADFSGYGLTLDAVGRMDPEIRLGENSFLSDAAIGSLFYLGDECVRLDAFNAETAVATVGRGCVDTLPREHAVGTLLIAASASGLLDLTERSEGETVYYRAQPKTAAGFLPEADATVHSITVNNRFWRPYLPGNIRLNTELFPVSISGELTVSWAHRNKYLQTAGLLDFTDGSVTPDPAVTYTLRLYTETGELVREEAGLTGTSYTWSTEIEDSTLDCTKALLNFNGTNGSTTFTDAYGNTWTAYGNAQLTTSGAKFGSACLVLDGTGDYISTPSDAKWSVSGNKDITIEAWVYPNVNNAVKSIANRRPAGTAHEWSLHMTATGKAEFIAWDNGTAVAQVTSTSTIPTNAWTHIAAVRKNGWWRIFVNGVNEDADSESGQPSNSSTALTIGRDPTTNARDFDGRIDDFRFTKGRALYWSDFTPPSNELSVYYDGALLNMNGSDGSTSIVDETGKTWTAYGNAQLDTGRFKYGSASLLLDGSGSYIETTDGSGLDVGDFEWSCECWAWVDTSHALRVIASKRDFGTDDGGWELGVDATGKPFFKAYTGSSEAVALLAGDAITVDAWHHIAVCRIAGNWCLWIDGSLAAQDDEATAPTANSAPLLVGRTGTSSSYHWVGSIDDMRIVSGRAMYRPIATGPLACGVPLDADEAEATDGGADGLLTVSGQTVSHTLVAGGAAEEQFVAFPAGSMTASGYTFDVDAGIVTTRFTVAQFPALAVGAEGPMLSFVCYDPGFADGEFVNVTALDDGQVDLSINGSEGGTPGSFGETLAAAPGYVTLYYNAATGEFGAVVDGVDKGYIGNYTGTERFPLAAVTVPAALDQEYDGLQVIASLDTAASSIGTVALPSGSLDTCGRSLASGGAGTLAVATPAAQLPRAPLATYNASVRVRLKAVDGDGRDSWEEFDYTVARA